MNQSQFRKAMTHVKNLENSIRIYVVEYYHLNIGYTNQEAVRSASNLLFNCIPIKYLTKEHYHMNMNEILGEILYHLNRIEDIIEELSKIDRSENGELTHIAYQHEETFEFFCELMAEEFEKEFI